MIPPSEPETESQPEVGDGPLPDPGADELAPAGLTPDASAPPLTPWERLVDNLSTLALLLLLAVGGGGWFLARLPERVQPWLVEQVYDDEVSWRTLILCVPLAGLFALGTVRAVGRDRLLAAWASLRRLGPAAILGAAWTAMPAVNGTLLLLFMPTVAEWLQINPGLGLLLYVVIFVFSAGFGMLPTYAQAILAGFVFGVWVGVPAALAGFTGAAVVGHVVAKTVSRDRVRAEIARSPKAEAVREALLTGSPLKRVGIVALLRLPPNSPFALTNLVLAASGAKLPAFTLGTSIGMIPRTAAAVVIGTQVDTIIDAERPWWLGMLGIIATVIVLIVLGLIANKALRKVVGEQAMAPRRTLRRRTPSTPA